MLYLMKSTKVQNPRRRGTTHVGWAMRVVPHRREFCTLVLSIHIVSLLFRLLFFFPVCLFFMYIHSISMYLKLNHKCARQWNIQRVHHGSLKRPTYARSRWTARVSFFAGFHGILSLERIHLLVVHNPLVPLIGRLVACSSRTRADRQTDRHARRGLISLLHKMV